MNKKITLADVMSDSLDQEYRDKVFWYAHFISSDANGSHGNQKVSLYIDSSNCLTAFDDIAKQLQLVPISSLASQGKPIQKLKKEKLPVLLASGSFLWINNKLLVTQRTADTKYDPLHWTTPAGRCDMSPLQTAYKETAEEIHGFSKKTNQLWMPKPTLKYLPQSDVTGYEVTIGFPDNASDLPLTTVDTYIDGKLYESTLMWLYYSQAVNTLELRLPMCAYIDEPLYFVNSEFDTDAKLMSIKELKQLDVVPAVAKLIKEIGDD